MKNISRATTIVGLCLSLYLSANSNADSLGHWQPQSVSWPGGSFDRVSLFDATYANGKYVAVGCGFAPGAYRECTSISVVSNDGVNWIGRPMGLDEQGYYDLRCVTYGGGRFVAGGYDGTIVTSDGDGSWIIRHQGGPHQGGEGYLWGAAYGNGRFVVVGSGGSVLTSDDGLTWTERSAGVATYDFKGITYGNGTFVAVGWDAELGSFILTSADAVTWTNRTPGVIGGLTAVAYGNGAFVAVGDALSSLLGAEARIVTSKDGVSWIQQSSLTNLFLTAVCYGNGQFVIAGLRARPRPDGEIGVILSSTDGQTWISRDVENLPWVSALAFGGGTFKAFSSGQKILQSGDITAPCLIAKRRSVGGGIELTVTSELGRSCRLQASTNLATSNWLDLFTYTNNEAALTFLDTNASNLPQRFYRVVSP